MNSSVYILVNILRINKFFYCAMTIKILFILFKLNRFCFEKYKSGIHLFLSTFHNRSMNSEF